jgi:hypothetical protein
LIRRLIRTDNSLGIQIHSSTILTSEPHCHQ